MTLSDNTEVKENECKMSGTVEYLKMTLKESKFWI